MNRKTYNSSRKSHNIYLRWKLLGSIKQVVSVYAGQFRSLKVLLIPVPGQKQGKGVGSYMVV